MEGVYFQTDSSGTVEMLCTPGMKSSHTWKKIVQYFEQRGKPVGTEAEPVIVTGEPRVHGESAEGEPVSKKTKRSPDEFQLWVPAAKSELVVRQRQSYFEKLLEAPLDLPRNAEDLLNFLSATPIKLPLLLEPTYSAVALPDYVEVCTSEAVSLLAAEVETAFSLLSDSPPTNEATNSALLFALTGEFLEFLNTHAPANLINLSAQLDTTGGTGTSAMSTLQPLKSPDCQVFVKGVLLLRWENKFEASDLRTSMDENSSKLCVWSPLYYGTLPYVIGGCCGGQVFQWLMLSPNGKEIVVEPISKVYDWKKPKDLALLLHSTIRMHCLLQRLQKELPDFPPLKLYAPIPRSAGGVVTVYPGSVCKTVPALLQSRQHMLKSLYDSIKGSRYLIQLIYMQTTRERTTILLEPVGDPNARPRVLKDLEAAVHDILHGLVDLHKQGYTHRDLRWENFIKVNVEGVWKWMVIDLETVGLDEEEWVGDGLRGWDARTLEDRDGKKIYTKGSDMYQLGKLIVEWLVVSAIGGQAMRALGENMEQERGAAAKMLEGICTEDCKRCGKFDV